MLDNVQDTGVTEADYVEFETTGSPAVGTFHCSGCGYGVTVRTTLPRCPMCSGETWEHSSTSTFNRPRRLL